MTNFRTRRRTFMAALAGLAVAGAHAADTASATRPPPAPGHGRVWFYRMAPRATPGAWQDIYLDGAPRAQANPRDVFSGDVQAGPHTVKIMGNTVRFTLEEGQEVFIRSEADPALFGKGIYPVMVDRETARAELLQKGIDIDKPRAAAD